jgi:hypothetical protein
MKLSYSQAPSPAPPGHHPRPAAAGRAEAMRTAAGVPQARARACGEEARPRAPGVAVGCAAARRVRSASGHPGGGDAVSRDRGLRSRRRCLPLEPSLPDVQAAPVPEPAPRAHPADTHPSSPRLRPPPSPAPPTLASDPAPPTPQPPPAAPSTRAPDCRAPRRPQPPPAAPAPVLSFSERAARALQKFSNSAGLRGCFTDAVPSMVVTVTIAADTGVGTVSVPKLKVGSTVANCIEKELAKAAFRKGRRWRYRLCPKGHHPAAHN